MLLLHIVIALSSIGLASLLTVYPSRDKLYACYALVVLTLTSGSYLVLTLHTNLKAVCTTGLLYLSFVAVCIAVAHYRLALAKARS